MYEGRMMMESLPALLAQIVTITVTARAIHWLRTSRGPSVPRTLPDGSCIYGIKWQWKAVGLITGSFAAVLVLISTLDLPSVHGWIYLVAFAVLTLSGIWLATGLVTTDSVGVNKKGLWRSRSMRWDEITKIELRSRDIGAIELQAGARKLIVDSRFVGFQHLLNEITRHTSLQPTGALPPSLYAD
jgi:hypothetical protein